MIHPIKYVLYVIMALVSTALLFIAADYIPARAIEIDRKIGLAIKIGLTGASAILLITYLWDIPFSYLRAGLAVLIAYSVPGYFLIEFLNFPSGKLDPLEKTCFSFGYSLFLTFLLSLALAPLGTWTSGLVLSALFLALSSAILIKDLMSRRGQRLEQKTRIDIREALAFAVSCGSVLFMVFYYYPSMMRIPGLDIVEISRKVKVWLRTPHLLKTVYPSFILSEATAYLVSGAPSDIVQTALEFLNIYILASALLFARATLSNAKQSAIALLIFTFFAGLGWLYIAINMPFGDPESYSKVIRSAFGETYMDIRQGGAIDFLLWYRPRSAALVLLLLIIYFIITIKASTWKKRLSLALLFAALFFMHVVEYVLILIALVMLSFFRISSEIKLKEVMLALISSWVFFMPVYGLSWTYDYGSLLSMVPISLTVASTGMALIAFIPLRFKRASISLGPDLTRNLCKVVGLFVFFSYFASIPAWLTQVDEFSLSAVADVGFLPWFFYPVLLGISGPLAVVGLDYVSETPSAKRSPIALLITLILSSLLLGKIVSSFNLMFFYTGYKERRFIKYISVLLAPLATMGILNIFQSVSHGNKLHKDLWLPILTSVMVLIGSLSFFYSVERWAITIEDISTDDEDAIRFLSSLVDGMKVSKVLTVSKTSKIAVRRAGPTVIIDEHAPAIWASSHPELTFSLLYEEGLGPHDKYILYMHQRDKALARRFYKSSFMYSYMLDFLEEVYRWEKGSIYVMPQFSPPEAEADVVLVIREDPSETYWAYALLSLGRFEYTTAIEDDPYILEQEFLIIPTDRIPAIFTYDSWLKWLRAGGTAIIIGGDGFGGMAKILLSGRLEAFVEEPGAHILGAGGELLRDITSFRGELEVHLINSLDENEPAILADDDQTAFWIAKAWGSGTIGVPELVDDEEMKTHGSSALRIEVGDGDKARWAICHYYDPGVNWTGYDFISFYWYGHGDGGSYVVWIEAPDVENRLWFYFVDDWTGWRRVFLPLSGIDGPHIVNGVRLRKVTHGKPDLSDIRYISIRPGAGSPNLRGTWYLDRVVLDVGRWTDLHVRARNSPLVNFYLFNGSRYALVRTVNEEGIFTVPADQVVFSDGSNGSVLYGSQADVMYIRARRDEDDWVLDIEVKLPASGGEAISDVRFFFTTPGHITATEVLLDDEVMTLPTPINCSIIVPKEEAEVLGYYSDREGKRTALLISMRIENGTLFYVNAYPILNKVEEEHGLSADLMPILHNVLRVLGVERAEGRKVVTSSHIVFERATAFGHISIKHKSISVLPVGEELEIWLEDGTRLDKIASLALLAREGDLLIETGGGNISGSGFYLCLETRALEITMRNGIAFLSLCNGSVMMLDITGSVYLSGFPSIRAYVRRASVNVSGKLYFNNTYICSYFERRFKEILKSYFTGSEISGDVLRVLWDDIALTGDIHMQFYIGGGMGVITMSFRGEAKIIPPPMEWDEARSLVLAWPWLILAGGLTTISYTAIWLLKKLKRSRRGRS